MSENEVYSPDNPPVVSDKELLRIAVVLHGHLGPFLVFGVRMGLLARSILNFKGHFDVKVTVFAGKQPPVSCMADGLQISTGATLGKGNIVLVERDGGLPKAIFEVDSEHLEISLSPFAMDLTKGLNGYHDADKVAREVAWMPDNELFSVLQEKRSFKKE